MDAGKQAVHSRGTRRRTLETKTYPLAAAGAAAAAGCDGGAAVACRCGGRFSVPAAVFVPPAGEGTAAFAGV